MDKLGLQRSVQWMMDRVGKVTASRFKDVTAALASGKPAKAREDYLFEVVIERLTGNPVDHYISKPMQDGIEREPFARMKYEAATGAIVEEVGFLPHPELAAVGGSPDGLVDADGMIEIKCPTASTHLRTLLDGMPVEHSAQIQGLLWITGRAWCDFVSYYPDLQPPLDLHIQRVERDDDYIKGLDAAVRLFDADADALVARLRPGPKSAPESEPPPQPPAAEPQAEPEDDRYITPDQAANLETACQDAGVPLAKLRDKAGVARLALIERGDYARALAWINKHTKAA